MADQAGRVSMVLGQRGKGIRYALAGAAVAVLVIVGPRYYAGWRIGHIVLFTDDAPVVAQVLEELSDQPIGEPFDLHSRAKVSLPAGEYRLRVTGLGRLSRTYRFAVNRGETLAHTISIDEGRLLGGERAPVEYSGEPRKVAAIPFATRVVALELTPGKSDLIAWSGDAVVCRDGLTGAVRWDVSRPAKPFPKGHDPTRWLRLLDQGEPAEPAADLDGDGTRDLLAYFPKATVLLALSGKDGSILWNFIAQVDGPGGPHEGDPERNDIKKEWGLTAGKPAMADADRDGIPDFFVTFVFPNWSKEDGKPAPAPESMEDGEIVRRRCTVAAISGRTGRTLWTHPVDQNFPGDVENAHVEPAALVPGKPSTLLGFVDNQRWLGLDSATGVMKAGPVDLGFVPLRPVQTADLDGDGELELVATEAGGASRREKVHVFSIKHRRELWALDVDAPWAQTDEGALRPPFPFIADLDDDGKPEIAVPDAGSMLPLAGYRGLRLLDGRTGETRWRRAMRPESNLEDGLATAVVGPDLDGDGTRELVTVSLGEPVITPLIFRKPSWTSGRVYVDAHSGKDGRPLWWWSAEIPANSEPFLWAPLWFGRGPDGRPLLAVPLGGLESDESRAGFGGSSLAGAPSVHLLEASTGKELHVIDGLAQAGVNDLDGDGLTDLWGEVDGELRAFRGEAPEVWRALGTFSPAVAPGQEREVASTSWVDLDGDQIADAVLGGPGELASEKDEQSGSHTVMARSGRDGHLIWKTELDPWEYWLDPGRNGSYDLSFASPLGDFNGDGTPDVIVRGGSYEYSRTPAGRAATLGLLALSGRTGARLWSAAPLPGMDEPSGAVYVFWFQTCAVERNGAPDLFAIYWRQFTTPVPGSTAVRSGGISKLARVSGRDGRFVWNIELPGEDQNAMYYSESLWTLFDDLDGDGGNDLVMLSTGGSQSGESEYTLNAISLRDGRQLWSRAFRAGAIASTRLADKLDGPDRPSLVVMEQLDRSGTADLIVQTFDARDGQARWASKAATGIGSDSVSPRIVSANLEGNGLHDVCVSFNFRGGQRRILVLDSNGKERARRDLKGDLDSVLEAADTNGDGRDELITFDEKGLRALTGDLKDLWSWPSTSKTIDAILPGKAGRPCEVILSPALSLDGATGVPRWTGQHSLTQGENKALQFLPELLDPGDAKRLPLLIASGLGATVCREALRTDARGMIAAARGTVVKPGPVSGDPRWSRPLPWATRLRGPLGPWGFLTAAGLGCVNLVLPLFILRLVRGRRRAFSMRGLMMLPVVAAIPLMVLLTLVPWLPLASGRLLGTERRLFLTGTLAGVPIVLCALWLCASLVRLRFRPVVTMAGLTAAATLVVAGCWLWFDRKSMAAMQHYDREGWYLVLLPGAYAAAVLWAAGRMLMAIYRFVTRRSVGV
jgi:PQQ-like domain